MNSKVKLSFTKRIEKKILQPSALKYDAGQTQKVQEKQTIDSFDKNAKRVEVAQEEELVIPLVASNRTSILKEKSQNLKEPNKEESLSNSDKTLDELAAAAVVNEVRLKNNEYSRRIAKEVSAIQVEPSDDLQTHNEVGEVSSLEDYDKINIESFGSALLRGMGWNKAAGVGRNNKKVVEIIEPSSKTFSIDIDQKQKANKSQNDNSEEEELKKGSFVLICSGRNRGAYAVVESIDEDHLLVKSARGGAVLREVEANIKVVSAKEYQELSRVINKEMYDEYKLKESGKSKPVEDRNSSPGKEEESSKIKYHKERDKKDLQDAPQESKVTKEEPLCEKDRRTMPNVMPQDEPAQGRSFQVLSKHKRRPQPDTQLLVKESKIKHTDYDPNKAYPEDEKQSKMKSSSDPYSKASKKYSKYYEEKDSSRHLHKDSKSKKSKLSKYEEERLEFLSSQASIPVLPWATERLRVRIINKKYRNGRYHKEKVVVQSLETVERCTCISADGKVLDDLDPAWFETVIPKEEKSLVLILKGDYKGQKARILMLHKEKQKASLQLLQDSSIIVKLHYDDICEYVSR